MSVAIRNGSVCVLALGVVAGLATVRAASDISPAIAIGNVQPDGIASSPSGDETSLPEASISMSTPLYPCCPRPSRVPKFTCSNTQKMTSAQCRAVSGTSVASCTLCPLIGKDQIVNSEEEVETMGDDSPVTEPSGASPVEPAAGSAWNIVVMTLFLASL